MMHIFEIYESELAVGKTTDRSKSRVLQMLYDRLAYPDWS